MARQAYAGLLWSKQFYHYVLKDWLEGDPEQPPPPAEREGTGARNTEWKHLFNRDVVSMPDKWEYPWVVYAICNGQRCATCFFEQGLVNEKMKLINSNIFDTIQGQLEGMKAHKAITSNDICYNTASCYKLNDNKVFIIPLKH